MFQLKILFVMARIVVSLEPRVRVIYRMNYASRVIRFIKEKRIRKNKVFQLLVYLRALLLKIHEEVSTIQQLRERFALFLSKCTHVIGKFEFFKIHITNILRLASRSLDDIENENDMSIHVTQHESENKKDLVHMRHIIDFLMKEIADGTLTRVLNLIE